MNAGAAKTAAAICLQDFEAEVPTTVRLLQSIPASNLSYAPDVKSRTNLALCRHLVLNDLWRLDGVASGSYKPAPGASDACGLMTPADCAVHYAREMRSALQRIQERTDEELARNIELPGVYRMSAVGYLSMALRHSVGLSSSLTGCLADHQLLCLCGNQLDWSAIAAYSDPVMRIVWPALLAEVAFMLWLLTMGAKQRPVVEIASAVK